MTELLDRLCDDFYVFLCLLGLLIAWREDWCC